MHGPLNMEGSPQSWVSYEISNAEAYKGPYGQVIQHPPGLVIMASLTEVFHILFEYHR